MISVQPTKLFLLEDKHCRHAVVNT